MAISQSEYLLQEILAKTSSGNDHLAAMAELLVEMNKSLKKGSPGGGGGGGGGGPRPPPPDDTKRFSNMFKNMFGSMKGGASTMLGNNGTSANVLGSLGQSAMGVSSALGKAIPAIGGVTTAFNMIVDAGMKVYEYMNAQLEMYTQLNSAGITLATGMSTLERASAKGLMSNAEFGQALQKNADVLAMMEGTYGHGVENFGQLMNSVQKLQNVNGMYGVSQQQLADLTARNFKYQKLYGSQESLRNMDQSQSTELFVRQMTELSKSVGKSVDQLLGSFEGMTNSFDSQATSRALTRFWGKTEDEAAAMNKEMNSVFSSMGEFGVRFQAFNTQGLSLKPLSDEFNSQFGQMLKDRMMELQRGSPRSAKAIQQQLSKWTQEHAQQLQLEIDALYDAGNVPAAKFLQDFQNSMKLLNENTAEVSPVLEEFTNRFNNWLADTITGPFKTLWADTRDSTLQYLMDTYDSVDNFFMMPAKMFKDLFSQFQTSWASFGLDLLKIPADLIGILFNGFDPVKQAFSDFMGDLLDIPGRLASLIWGMITGDGWEKSSEGLKTTIGNIFTHVGDMFTSIGEMSFSYDDMKKKIQSSFDAMKSKIAGWWDSAKSWWAGEDPKEVNELPNGKPVIPPPTATEAKKTQPPKVTEPPKYTKPEKVGSTDDSDTATTTAVDPKQSFEEGIMKMLNNIVSATEQSNQINSTSGGYLRQIAENTTVPQNL